MGDLSDKNRRYLTGKIRRYLSDKNRRYKRSMSSQ